MKKFISASLVLIIVLLMITLNSFAEGTAFIGSDDFDFSVSGNKSADDICTILKGYDNGTYTKDDISGKLSSSLKHIDVYCDNTALVNDIYGIQLSVSVSSKSVALAYLTTNLQNGSKAGTSLWFGTLKAKDESRTSATILMYGTSPVNSKLNRELNYVSGSKYKVATLYYAVASNQKSNFNISYKIEDIAAKDSNNKVSSVSGKFKSETTALANYKKVDNNLSLDMLGAQIRVSGRQGIRFGSKLFINSYFKECSDISFGTLIAPTNSLEAAKITTDTMGVYSCPSKTLEQTKDYIVFSGEINNFPADGRYDNTNFTAVAYVKYKKPGATDYSYYYADGIIRNVNMIKSILKMK